MSKFPRSLFTYKSSAVLRPGYLLIQSRCAHGRFAVVCGRGARIRAAGGRAKPRVVIQIKHLHTARVGTLSAFLTADASEHVAIDNIHSGHRPHALSTCSVIFR